MSIVLTLGVMGFAVFAAASQTLTVTNTVSFVSEHVLATVVGTVSGAEDKTFLYYAETTTTAQDAEGKLGTWQVGDSVRFAQEDGPIVLTINITNNSSERSLSFDLFGFSYSAWNGINLDNTNITREVTYWVTNATPIVAATYVSGQVVVEPTKVATIEISLSVHNTGKSVNAFNNSFTMILRNIGKFDPQDPGGGNFAYRFDPLTKTLYIPEGVTVEYDNLPDMTVPNEPAFYGLYPEQSYTIKTELPYTAPEDMVLFAKINDGTQYSLAFTSQDDDYLVMSGGAPLPSTSQKGVSLFGASYNSETFGFDLTGNNYYSVAAAGIVPLYVHIPLTYNNLPVRVIANSAFTGSLSLRTIEISEFVTIIGNNAFNNSHKLTNVLVQGDLTHIGTEAFQNCESIEAINMPDSVLKVGYNAFNNTAWYDGLADGVVMIGKALYAYKGEMPENTELVVDDGTASITAYAFFERANLKNIELPESVTSIGEFAFAGCTNLQYNYLRNSVTEVGASAFADCDDLIIYVEPSSKPSAWSATWNVSGCPIYWGVTYVDTYNEVQQYVISNDNIIITRILVEEEHVVIPAQIDEVNVIRIGEKAFVRNSAIKSITIPAQITSIANSAFYECVNLETIYYNATNLIDLNEFNNAFAYAGQNSSGITVEVGANVMRIPSNLFYPNSNEVASPRISSVVFNGTSSVTSIGDNAFRNVITLTSFTIPESVVTIGASAFRNISGPSTITISQNVTTIGASAFIDCKNLENFVVHASNAYFQSINGILFNKNATTLITCPQSKTSVTIPASVINIAPYAFYNCGVLSSIALNATNLSDLQVNNFAFYGAGSLGAGIAVTVGANVTRIPAHLFNPNSNVNNSPKVANVIFESFGVCLSIGSHAFYGNTALDNIGIPSHVTTIGEYAFYGCSGLTESIIPTGISTIESYAFANCTGLTNLIIPSNITTIKSFAFDGCTGLTSITIPADVATINASAFRNTSNVTTIYYNALNLADLTDTSSAFFNTGRSASGVAVTIGSDVTRIPAHLFSTTSAANSPKITSVTFNGNSVASIGNYAFKYAEFASFTIPSSVTSLGDFVFFDIANLTDISVEIGSNHFATQDGILYDKSFTKLIRVPQSKTSVTIPNTVSIIANGAFYNCRLLTELVYNATFAQDLASNNQVFYNAGRLASGIDVTFGDDVAHIPAYLFNPNNTVANSPKLKSVNNEGSFALESIGAYAFANCNELPSIFIPISVSFVGANAFSNCSALVINVEASGKPAGWADNWNSSNCPVVWEETMERLYNNQLRYTYLNGTIIISEFLNNSAVVEIPEQINGMDVVAIDANSFGGCDALTTVTIPATVTHIGNGAFYGTVNLHTVYFNAVNLADFEQINQVFFDAGKDAGGITLHVGQTVSRIAANMFYPNTSAANAPKLANVVFEASSSCIEIGANAFRNAAQLVNVNLPASLTSIGEAAFYNASKLTTAYLAIGITTIENYTFYNCRALTMVSIHSGVTAIGEYAFYGCDGLTNVSIGSSVSSIGKYAFYNCSKLTYVSIPSGVSEIAEYTFYGNAKLEAVSIPGSVTSIGNNAFENCSALTAVVIPSGTTTIGDKAFFNSANIVTVNISDTVMAIGAQAFVQCAKLEAFVVDASSSYYASVNGALFNKALTILVQVPPTATAFTIPESVTQIGSYAFYRCISLASLTIGENITSIGAYAFGHCTGLSLVYYNATNATYGSSANGAFQNAGLASGSAFNIGSNVISIPAYLAYGSNFNSVLFGANSVATSIGNHAFYNSSRVTEIAFNATNMGDLNQNNNVFYRVGSGNTGVTVTIGANVTRIPANLFNPISSAANSPNIRTITFAEGSACSTIGNYAFAYLNNLTTINFNATEMFDLTNGNFAFAAAGLAREGIVVNIGAGVTRIPANLFNANDSTANAPKLTNVVFAENSSCEMIGIRAFAFCHQLASIVIPTSVTLIQSYVFEECLILTIHANAIEQPATWETEWNVSNCPVYWNAGGVKIYNNELQYIIENGTISIIGFLNTTNAVIIPEQILGITVTRIEENTFANYSNLISVTIPSTVNYIGDRAFENCTSIVNLTIPNGVTTIGNYVFSGCTNLIRINIPENVTSIGSHAFYNCSSLIEINYNATYISDFAANNNVFYRAGMGGAGVSINIGAGVTHIPAYLFSPVTNTTNRAKVLSVNFAEGSECQSIGAYAFAYCIDLINITLPASASSVNLTAFASSTNLENIFVHENNNSYSSVDGVLYNKAETTLLLGPLKKLTHIMPSTATTIFESAFLNGRLTSITLSASLTTIGADAFNGCNLLAAISIPANVASIGNNAFRGCVALSQISFNATNMPNLLASNGVFYNAGSTSGGIALTIGSGVTRIPAYLFNPTSSATNAPRISNLQFAENSTCTTIGAFAFAYINSLTAANLPNSVTTIEASTFFNCQYLTSITIPVNVIGIGASAFAGTSRLTEINFNAALLPDLNSNNGVFTSAGSSGDGIFVNVGPQVSRIPAYMFNPNNSAVSAAKLSAVYFALGGACQSIGTYAFAYNGVLSTITIPDTVTLIENHAFYLCSNLIIYAVVGEVPAGWQANWNISNCPVYWGAELIGTYNNMLQYVIEEGNVIVIAFLDNTSNVVVPAQINGYPVTQIADSAFSGSTSLVTVSLPSSLTTIGASAFSNCANLTTINIPQFVTSIGNNAFYNSVNLTTILYNAEQIPDLASGNNVFYRAGYNNSNVAVTIGASVLSIPAYMFNPNTNSTNRARIATVTFAEGSACTSIGAYAFAFSLDLTTITLPISLISISPLAFRQSSNLENIFVHESNVAFSSVDGVLYNKAQTTLLLSPERKTTHTMPSTATSIADYALYGNNQLTNLVVSDNLVTIGIEAFRGCTALASITIPEGVTSIGNGAFYGNTSLQTLYFNATSMDDTLASNQIFFGLGSGVGSGTEVFIGTAVTKIPAHLFNATGGLANRPKITSITYQSSSVLSIGNYAFAYCSALTAITIPESVTTIGAEAFRDCNLVTAILFNAVNMTDLASGNNVFYNVGQSAAGVNVNIGAQVLRVPAYMFNSTNTTSTNPKVTMANFDLGSNCQSIGTYAFANLANLVSLTIPNTVLVVENFAFRNCTILTIYVVASGPPAPAGWEAEWNFSNCPVYYDASMVGIYDSTLQYIYEDGAIHIIGFLNTTNNVVVPAEIGGYPVTTIGENTFASFSNITSVSLPSSITTIGNYAFFNCTSLTSITIPESVVTIGTYAFSGCTMLSEINFNANNMTDLASNNRVFYNAGANGAGITVNIGATVTKVPAYLFNPYNSTTYRPRISSVNFLQGGICESIGAYAFAYLSDLLSITLPESLSQIELYAFRGDSSLANILVHENNASFAELDGVVYNKTLTTLLLSPEGKTSHTMATSATSIADYALYSCSNLTEFVISNNVTSIGSYAFWGCTYLASITIPANVSSIGDFAFQNCARLQNLYYNATSLNDFDEVNAVFTSVGQSIVAGTTLNIGANVTRIPAYIFLSSGTRPKIVTINFAENSLCTSIGAHAFANLTALRTITLPESLVAIGNSAFRSCSALTTVYFNSTNLSDLEPNNNVFFAAGTGGVGFDVFVGAGVTRIPAYLFNPTNSTTNNAKLTTVEFAETSTCTSIGSYAFAYTTSFVSIKIPASVAVIEGYVFRNCTVLTIYAVAEEKPVGWDNNWNFSNCTVYWNADVIGMYNDLEFTVLDGGGVSIIAYTGSSSAIVIPNRINGHDVVSIGDNAFANLTSITSVSMPSTLISIGANAFFGCSFLSSIVIPENVTSIGIKAFEGCSRLAQIYFYASNMQDLTSSNRVFYNAGSVVFSTVHIGASVTRIPAYMFNPSTVDYRPRITTVIFAEDSACESIGNYAFANANLLTSINLPEGLLSIGNFAFYNVSILTNITLPESLQTIGASAFSNCSALNGIFIPVNVMSVGLNAFSSSNNINDYFVDENNPYLTSIDGVLYDKDLTTVFMCPTSKTTVNMPLTITTIADYAFSNCQALTSITIPELVTYIGVAAFSNARSVSEIYYNAINLPDFVSYGSQFSSIGYNYTEGTTLYVGANVTRIPAFMLNSNSHRIYHVVFAEGSVCESIGASAFRSSLLKTIALPNSLVTVETLAFFDNQQLTSLTIGEGLVTLGSQAFYNLTRLTEINFNAINMDNLGSANNIFYAAGSVSGSVAVTFGANVSKVPSYLFFPTTTTTARPRVTSVVFAEGSVCTSIELGAFANNTYLVSVVLPEGMLSIGQSAFSSCTSLTSINLPDSITTIGASAFVSCSSLTSIHIPRNLISLGSNAFNGTLRLESIYFAAVNLADLPSGNGVMNNSGSTSASIALTVGKDVTKIPAYMFNPSNNLNTRPRLTSIVFEAESACISIGMHALSYSNFASISLPTRLQAIGAYAFAFNSEISELYLPEQVETVTLFAFRDMAALININVAENNPYLSSVDGVLYNKNQTIVYVCPSANAFLGEMPSTVQVIEQYAFYNNSSMTTITIPEGVTSIGIWAFYGTVNVETINFNATNITTNIASANRIFYDTGKDGAGIQVNIGATVTHIPSYLFSPLNTTNNSPKIISVNFAEGSVCSSIGTNAFAYILSLQAITIPENITSIGIDAFYGLINLTELNYNAIALPNYTNTHNTFYNAGSSSGGVAVNFGASVSSIPNSLFYASTLAYYPRIVSISFADNSVCESIGSYAFYYVASLTTITLPKNLKTIGFSAFASQPMLTTIYLNSTSLNNLSTSAVFNSTGISGDGITLYVSANVTRIPDNMFYANNEIYRANLKLVVFEEGSVLDSIGANSFCFMPELTSITIPASTTSVASNAFRGSANLVLSLQEGSTSLSVLDNVLYDYNQTVLILGSGLVQTVVMPNTVTTISAAAFYDCKLLTSVTISEGVTSIGNQAFYGCSALSEINYNAISADNLLYNNYAFLSAGSSSGAITLNIGESVTHIPNYLFNPTTNSASRARIAVVNFAENSELVSIGNYAFRYCIDIARITIPSSVTSIGILAFADTTGLTDISFEATNMSNLQSNSNVFQNAGRSGAGISVVITANVTRIPAYLFYVSINTNYANVKTIVFDQGSVCTIIGAYAFNYFQLLESIIIPSSITTIGAQTFGTCPLLKTVYVHSELVASSLSSTTANGLLLYSFTTGNELFILDSIETIHTDVTTNFTLTGVVTVEGVEYKRFTKN